MRISDWSSDVCSSDLLARTAKDAAQFEERFWSGGNLADLYESVRRDPNVRGEAAVFVAGYEEFVRQQTSGKADPDDVLAAVQRQLRVAHTREEIGRESCRGRVCQYV